MEGILKFDTSEPDEFREFMMAATGRFAFMAIHEISELIRKAEDRDEKLDVSKFREEFYEILESRGVDMEFLY